MNKSEISPGSLFVVATPIGNLQDVTSRAVEVLKQVSRVAAEDTRHTRKLFAHLGIATPLFALHDHNEETATAKVLQLLAKGEDVALVSDAGTPLISDPGFFLVRAARANGYRVVPVPGPSALVTALSVAGLPTDRFVFEGFLPSRRVARRKRLQALCGETRTVIVYESSHRVCDSLDDMVDIFGPGREAFIAREMTKTFETFLQGALEALRDRVQSEPEQQKGEFVIVIAGAEAAKSGDLSAADTAMLEILLDELPLKQAAALAAKITGQPKNRLYDFGLSLKK